MCRAYLAQACGRALTRPVPVAARCDRRCQLRANSVEQSWWCRVDVGGDDPAIGAKREPNGKRAVAGEGSNFEVALHAHEPGEQRHQLTLLGSEKHIGAGKARAFLAEPLEQFRFAQSDLPQVILDRVGQDKRAWRHMPAFLVRVLQW